MRGALSQQKLEEIDAKLPVLDKRFLLATDQAMGVDLTDLIQGARLGVALVCLKDAGERFNLARCALHEVYACLEWYREDSPKAPLEIQAALMGKFYADYAALLLYAAGEDIAQFTLDFLGIESEFESYLQDPQNKQKGKKVKNISSKFVKVRIFLASKYPNHPINEPIITLDEDSNWQETIKYRNTWVHEQPPIIHGLGIQYNRKSRVSDDGRSISFGGGSEYKYTVDELLRIVESATNVFSKALSKLLDVVVKYREDLGETFDFGNNRIVS